MSSQSDVHLSDILCKPQESFIFGVFKVTNGVKKGLIETPLKTNHESWDESSNRPATIINQTPQSPTHSLSRNNFKGIWWFIQK